MATKRAVVVGISDYSKWKNASNLKPSVGNAKNMKGLLINSFGFSPSEITVYVDDKKSKPTRRNILSGLNAMISKSEAGDVAFFYFAGHGTMVGSGTSKDAWYEAICAYDNKIITDFDFAKATTDKLEPSHVNFTVMLDCCHSGGMHGTDVLQKIAQMSLQMSSDVLHEIAEEMKTLIPCGVCLPDFGPLENNVSNVCVGDYGITDLDEDPDKTLIKQSKSTLISACRFYEVSWVATFSDGSRNSLLTKALLDTVDKRSLQISYHDLLDKLRPKVNEYLKKFVHTYKGYEHVTQRPQLRGQKNRMEENFLEGWTQSK